MGRDLSNIFNLIRIYSLKYQRSPTSGGIGISIRKYQTSGGIGISIRKYQTSGGIGISIRK